METARGLAIYGTGDFGHRIYRQCRWRYRIECFLESRPRLERLFDLTVCSLQDFLGRYEP